MGFKVWGLRSGLRFKGERQQNAGKSYIANVLVPFRGLCGYISYIRFRA